MSTRPRRIVFRLELGGVTGWGHLARCGALAAEMRERGWTCIAWTDSRLDAAPEDLRAPFDEIVPAGPGWAEQPPAEVHTAGWIVVDDYRASDDVIRRLRDAASRAGLFVVDDEAARALDAAHVVLNTRLGLARSPYAPGVHALLGERYALLRGGLRSPAKIASPFTGEQRPVLVMLGGTDPHGYTATVVEALADMDARHIAPVVVHSRSLAGGEAVTRALERFATSERLERVNAPTLAGWAGVCQCAISACGGTLYELAALGLPFLGVVVAENQRALARAVAQSWQMPVVEGGPDLGAAVASAMGSLPFAPHGPFGGIDLLGAARVGDVLESA